MTRGRKPKPTEGARPCGWRRAVAFLFTLTDDKFKDLNQSELTRQTKLKGTRPQRDTAVAMGKKGDLGDVGVKADQGNPANMGVYGKP